MVLNISLIVALKIALKPAPKPKSIKALKPRAVAKPKLAGVIKYKDKTIKLYTFYIYNIKAPAIKGGRGAKFKNKLSKAIVSILDGESSSSNNTSIEDNNKDELIEA